MLAKRHLHEKAHPLSLDIPPYHGPSSTLDSSFSSSPTPILGSTQSRTDSGSLSASASTSSLHAASLSVTFAPLPKLAPRKRKSSAPLGMAARGQLASQRRNRNMTQEEMYQGGGAGGGNPMWTDEELDRQRNIRAAHARRRHRTDGMYEEEDEEEEVEDPFGALSKIVKVASRSIWRKVSQKDLSKGKSKKETQGEGEGEGEGKNFVPPTTPASEKPGPEPPLSAGVTEERFVLATITSNGEDLPAGKKDEEDGSPEHFSSVGQTETIVEGHTKYSWAATGKTDSDSDGATAPNGASSPTIETSNNFLVL